MSLQEYVRKRKFANTPEPKPASVNPAAKTQGRFYVQRHDATRLHYDFRLEIEGTLKSWAVPKGPSLVPLHKSLAMHVEDHPLDYGPFEGNIPKGNYGGGSVMLWDQGTFDLLGDASASEQIARGDLKFCLHGQKLNGDFALVLMKGRGKGNEWLLIKKRDEFSDPDFDVEALAVSVKTGRTQDEIAADLPPKKTKKARAISKKAPAAAPIPGAVNSALPGFFAPMAAYSADHPPEGAGWIYEVKWDGVRALCFIEGGSMTMLSRNGNSFDRQYPELSVVPHYVEAQTAILDGEIAVFDAKGRSDFGLIQPRIHQTDPNSISHLVRKTPVKLLVFDLLYWNGFDLRQCALADRKKLLKDIVKPGDRIQYSEHFEAKGQEMLEAARQTGLEGVIAKRADSKYESRRSRNWLKVKITGHQEFIICGYTHGERSTFSSLVLGLYENGKLVYVGNAGTGFNDQSLSLLSQKMAPLETDKCPFGRKPAMLRRTTWVEPQLVCEIKFSEWTKDNKLRAPVFLGLRDDKKPEECVREKLVNPDTIAPDEQAASEERTEEPLIPADVKEYSIQIDGQPLKFTNVKKIWYPKDGYTKRDLLNYYDAVAGLILPYLKDRPLSLKRYPNGIHEEFFFQKNTPETYPDWLRTEPIYSEHRGAPIRFVVCDNRATLLYLVNLGCIDQNPWMSRIGSLECPDYVLIDLDPQECDYEKIIEAARLVHEKLKAIGIEGFPKTTGGDGMHIFIPIDPRYSYDQVRSFAEILSSLVVSENPDLFTTPRSVSKRRKGRVYFDYLQISSGKTIAGPYVVRAYDGAPVATPLDWNEVEPGLRPDQFTIRNAMQRFEQKGDLFAPILTKKQRLEPALRKLAKLLK